MQEKETDTNLSELKYLQELFRLTNGRYWYNNSNWDFTNWSSNNPCIREWYGLLANGRSPNCNIFKIDLASNNLSGILPNHTGNFPQLVQFDVQGNFLRGKLPFFDLTPHIISVSLGRNQFTGSIPLNMLTPSISPRLQVLDLKFNSLTGFFPDWLYRFPNLMTLLLEQNHFEGSIKENITQLTQLRQIDLSNNQFNGSIPKSLSSLRYLKIFVADNNSFSGTLTSSHIAASLEFSVRYNNLQGAFPNAVLGHQMNKLDLSSNYFSGTISREFCNYMKLMNIFSISDNLLSGTYPSCAMAKTMLELDYNLFHGEFLTNITVSEFRSLLFISFGYNRFSGPFPTLLFAAPRLFELAAPNNCFEGGMSHFPCENLTSLLLYVDLNGLYSSSHCEATKHHSEVTKRLRHFGGPFPSCLLFTRIKELSLSGNGFTGSLPVSFNGSSDNQTLFSLLKKLDLSHNYLTGRLPDYLLAHSFENLDLSYNRFHGSIQNLSFHVQFLSPEANLASSSLKLKKNRLSGRMPDQNEAEELLAVQTVDILQGNLLDCLTYSESGSSSSLRSLLRKDVYGSLYSCEASAVDNGSYGLVVAIVLMALGAATAYFLRPERVRSWLELMRKTWGDLGISEEEQREVKHVLSFAKQLRTITKCAGLISAAIFFLLLPFYGACRDWGGLWENRYEKSYGWAISSVYLRGERVAAVLWVMVLLLSVMALLLLRPANSLKGKDSAPSRREIEEEEEKAEEEEKREGYGYSYEEVLQRWDVISMRFLFFAVAVGVSGGMNLLYVMIVNNEIAVDLANSLSLVGITLGMALFHLTWNRYFLPLGRRFLRNYEEISGISEVPAGHCQKKRKDEISPGEYEKKEGETEVEERSSSSFFFLLMLNQVWSGWIIVLLKDDSCFQSLFFSEQQQQIAVFAYDDCQYGSTKYPFEKICYHESAFPLPFLYYYDCGAKVLSLFLPIWLYYYLLSLLVSLSYHWWMVSGRALWMKEEVQGNDHAVFVASSPSPWRKRKRLLFVEDEIYNEREEEEEEELERVGRRGRKSKKRSKMLLDREEVMSWGLADISMLLCYGLHYPPLAVLILMGRIVEEGRWRYLIKRFLRDRAASRGGEGRRRGRRGQVSSLSRLSAEAEDRGDVELIEKKRNNGAEEGEDRALRLPLEGGEEEYEPSRLIETKKEEEEDRDIGEDLEEAVDLPRSDRFFVLNPLTDTAGQREPSSSSSFVEEDPSLWFSRRGKRLKKLDRALAREESQNWSWKLLYLALLFNAVIVFDMVGDERGWTGGGFWVVLLTGIVMIVGKIIERALTLLDP